MAARKKSGKITLRMDPEVHARVAKTAKALGIDLNGLLNLLIRTNLFSYELMALQCRDPKGRASVQRRIDQLSQFSIEVTELQRPIAMAVTEMQTNEGLQQQPAAPSLPSGEQLPPEHEGGTK
ncbi:MAG: toxin-antitoxin system HicB family antitoxin [Gemmataceae bacterium]